LVASGFASTPSASRTAINNNTGFMGVTASAGYNFSFMLPVWRGIITQVSQTTQLGY
jgi:hypothetical protein